MQSYRIAFYVLVLIQAVIWILYVTIEPSTRIKQPVKFTITHDNTDMVDEYLVNSSKCKIKNLHPFNPDALKFYEAFEYTSCSTKKILTYTTKNNNIAMLHINKSAIPFYSKYGVICCYSYVTRENNFKDERARKKTPFYSFGLARFLSYLTQENYSKKPDNAIKISDCKYFEDEAILSDDIVFVVCRHSIFLYEVYKNVHAVITVREKVKQKMIDFKKTEHKPLSVLLVGIDSIAKLNLIRTMPHTYAFLENNGWIGLKGYNKIGENTYPNVMAFMTGMNDTDSFTVCKPYVLGQLDTCKILWYDYQKLGYVTAYAEDECDIGTFVYQKMGFTKQPTDYYFRPYMLAAERKLKIKLLHGLSHCVGPETSGERILNIAKEFAETFKNHPYFGFFWMNTFSHNNINSASRMDDKVLQFLKDLTTSKVLENTITIFLSDHGNRFGKFGKFTQSGWMEDRLPFVYFYMPYWFKNQHPDILRNLHVNTGRLTTPYDMYMTLQNILAMSGMNYSTKKSTACPLCRSLFEEVDPERSCEEAAIEPHWCTCGNDVEIDKESNVVQAASKYAVDAIHDILKRYKHQTEKCDTFKIKKIVSSYITKTTFSTNTTQLRVIFETNPQAVFGATISVSGTILPSFALLGPISRLDSYADHSWCVNDSTLKLYCYCLSKFMH